MIGKVRGYQFWITKTLIILNLALLPNFSSASARTFFVDQLNSSCNDSGSATEAIPFCTIKASASLVQPGDTVKVANGRYGDSFGFTRSGQANAPIIYQATGNAVYFGAFFDIPDEQLTRISPNSNVYSYTIPSGVVIPTGTHQHLSQGQFNPITVNDANDSKFTLVKEDGPIALTTDRITSAADVETVEGSFFISGRTLYVHPYDHRSPSTANTDLVLAANNTITPFKIGSSINYYTFENFKLLQMETDIQGSNNTFKNITSYSGLYVGGKNNLVDGLVSLHAITRSGQYAGYPWENGGGGDGAAIQGENNVLKNSKLYHNWNALNAGGLNNTLDAVEIHGAPNHCWTPGGLGMKARNIVAYNCQDYNYTRTPNGYTIENSIFPQGILLQGPAFTEMIYRNNIFLAPERRFLNYVTSDPALLPADCSFQSKLTIENNLILVVENGVSYQDTMAYHCEGTPLNQVQYPLREYIRKCEANELANCPVFRNNVLIKAGTIDPTEIIKGGKWLPKTDSWDFHVSSGSSPLVNMGVAVSFNTDFDGKPRSINGGVDIGPDEFYSAGGDENNDDENTDSDTDSDGDGAPDTIDQCLNDANKTVAGACGCGISDADIDGDGTADCLDLCPNDPQKSVLGSCGCGVSDDDQNGNGQADCQDPSVDSRLNKPRLDVKGRNVVVTVKRFPNASLYNFYFTPKSTGKQRLVRVRNNNSVVLKKLPQGNYSIYYTVDFRPNGGMRKTTDASPTAKFRVGTSAARRGR